MSASSTSGKGINNVVFASRIARFLNSGIALHNLMNVSATTHDAVQNYSYGSFEQLISQANIEKDAEQGDITLALMALQTEKQINWRKPIFELAKQLKIDELNDLFRGVTPVQGDASIPNKVSINTALPDGSTILHYVCWSASSRWNSSRLGQGTTRMFDMIMTHRPNLNIVTRPRPGGRTLPGNERTAPYHAYPLLLAAVTYNLYMVRKLVEAGASFYPPGAISPALGESVAKGHIDIVKYLLDKGDDINRQWISGGSRADCLTVAIRSRNLEMVELLLSRGAMPNTLHCETAIDYDMEDILKTLIGAGIHPDPQDLLFRLLTNRFEFRHLEDITESMIDYLVSLGADVNKSFYDIHGREDDYNPGSLDKYKPIMTAIVSLPEAIRALLKHHADTSNLDEERNVFDNVFDFIIEYCNSTKTVIENSRKSFEILVKSNIGETPGVLLYKCVRCRYYDGLEILHKLGYNMNQPPENNENVGTPLHYACRYQDFGDFRIIKQLLSYGADPNKRASPMHNYPLQQLIANFQHNVDEDGDHNGADFKDTVQKLVEHGACINERTENMSSALGQAFIRDMNEIIEILLQNGGDIELFNEEEAFNIVINNENSLMVLSSLGIDVLGAHVKSTGKSFIQVSKEHGFDLEEYYAGIQGNE